LSTCRWVRARVGGDAVLVAGFELGGQRWVVG